MVACCGGVLWWRVVVSCCGDMCERLQSAVIIWLWWRVVFWSVVVACSILVCCGGVLLVW